ncbi:hypothetical protein [Bradyrhizobium sp. BR 10261]|uniref:hypothetical protein n=1 Tax=Bradyrhizobium sp. BR 10261 TaxID=2749992 RepID=UPI001C646B5D|nr:hypothetical protein [Bradyrhizobium sp. BR 10261]MBW7965843.1 hypothetical protein [Bradyrhizobium sp. BR 10261]
MTTPLIEVGLAGRNGLDLLARIAIVHPTEGPEGLTIAGRRAYKAYFYELNKLDYMKAKSSPWSGIRPWVNSTAMETWPEPLSKTIPT